MLLGLILMSALLYAGVTKYRLLPTAALVLGVLVTVNIFSTAVWCGTFSECFLRTELLYHVGTEFAFAMIAYGIGWAAGRLYGPARRHASRLDH